MTRQFQIVVDGETFDVVERAHRGSKSLEFSWTSGIHPGYGFTSSRSDGASVSEAEATELARNFLANVDRSSGYLAD
jgi:hypothetical protein